MKKIVALLIVLILSSCSKYHYTSFLSGEYLPNAGLEKDELSNEDKIELKRVETVGEELIEYDRYSWESTDILLKEYDLDENKDSIKGWVIFKNGKKTNVCFGKLVDSVFVIKKTVEWKNDSYFLNDSVYTNPIATELYKAQKASLYLNKDYIHTYHPGTNTYALNKGDSIIIYLIPATKRDDIYLFGGGIRTIFDKKTNAILSNDVLHQKTYVYKNTSEVKMVVRPTFSNRLFDEVDYFQTKVTGSHLKAQYLMNVNYPRMISYVKTNLPDTEFIILKDNKR